MIYAYLRREGPPRPAQEPPPNSPLYYNDGKRIFQRRKAWIEVGANWQPLDTIESRNTLTSAIRARYAGRLEALWVEHNKRAGLIEVNLVGAIILTHDNRGGFLYARPKT